MSKSLPTSALLSSWETAMRAQALSPRTIEDRLRLVATIARELETAPEKLTAEQITEWLAGKHTAITKWTYFTHLRAFFRWLEMTEQITKNPTRQIQPPRRPKYLPRPVPEVHIRTVLAGPLRPQTRRMILLATYAGLRQSEIAKIHGNDYDPSTGILTVKGKGGHVATIPLHSSLQAELINMPRRSWWFPGSHGNDHMLSRSVGAAIQRAFRRHGIIIQAHQLRHSFGTSLIEADVNLRVAQELMRHQSIQSTALYTRISTVQKQSAVNRLDIPNES
ncbi:MAG: tyrosine-type recombinase/integrase [Ancrocorticia sp.]